jgi:Tol biopolymer transport system component
MTRRSISKVAWISGTVLLAAACTHGSSSTSSRTPAGTVSAARDLSGHILFGRVRMNGGDDESGVFTANADGTNQRRFQMPDGTCCPRISSDGTRFLVFTADDPDSPTGTPATMNVDGSGYAKVPIADPTLNYIPQAWSPDGERIAIEGWDAAHPGRNGIYTARVDGGDIRRLTSVKGIHDIPADYSPDGKRIVFYRTARPEPDWDLDGALWTVNVDGSNARRINTPGMMPSPYARWSPDGSKILFATARDQATGALWTVDADGSNLTKLFEDSLGRFAIGPEWSPDASKIMFSLDPVADQWVHPANAIYVINADGTGLAPVITGGSDFKGVAAWWR